MSEKNPLLHYEKLYSESNKVFGGGHPEDVVVGVAGLKTSGRVVELGAGQGRNALYLAAHGFDVRATDLAVAGVNAMKNEAEKIGVKIDAEQGDARVALLNEHPDVVVSTFVFHQLPDGDARALITEMKEKTNPGGLNAIATFTKEGDFWKENPTTGRFYPGSNELKEMYADWELIRYEERVRKANATNPDGTHKSNVVAEILVRKP